MSRYLKPGIRRVCVLSVVAYLSVSTSEVFSDESIKKILNESWVFDVFLNDDHIGYHKFDYYSDRDKSIIISKAEFDVSILFISLYSYKHDNKEIWVNNCLDMLDSSTDDNGDKQFVRLSRNNDTYNIETERNTLSSNGCLRTFAYWDKRLINYSSLLNSQTGEIVPVKFISHGYENIEFNNSQLLAEKYQLNGIDESNNIIEIDLWYSADNKWLALRSKLDSGSYLRYQLAGSNYK